MRRTLRTFVAVEISPEVIARAGDLIKRLSKFDAPVRWVSPQTMHFTIKFLGEVEALEIPQVCAAIEKAVRPLPPFECQLVGAGAFPDPDNPRTVWLGMGRGTEQMVKLHDAIDERLFKLGFRSEKRLFRPHLTLGRVRGARHDEISALSQEIKGLTDYIGGVTDVSEVVVFSSTLDRDGPTYEPLSHATLDGR